MSSETEWAKRQRRTLERAEHVAAHGPACQICGAIPKRGGLHQDHDHRSGLTRGWLCHRCNRNLPTWVDAVWLIKAALYLCGFSFGRTRDTVEAVLADRKARADLAQLTPLERSNG